MKKGRTLQELAIEIDRQQKAKKDMIASTADIEVAVADRPGGFELRLPGHGAFDILPLTHAQIAEHTKIPKPYYDRMMQEAPELLTTNIGEWFRKYPKDRMARTMFGRARAFMSSSYRPLENSDLAEAVLPVLQKLKVEIVSCDITDTRLYLKAVDQKVCEKLPAGSHFGDGKHTIVHTRELHPAISITNSEVGLGALNVEVGLYDGFCTNLAFFGGRGVRKYHIGGRHERNGDAVKILSHRTLRLQNAAIWSEVRDTVQNAFEMVQFQQLVDQVRETQKQEIKGDPVKVVDLTAKKFNLTDDERGSVLSYLIKGGDLSRFGLYNALTRAAEDIADYDRASEFERLGGKVIELPKNEWQQIAEAA